MGKSIAIISVKLRLTITNIAEFLHGLNFFKNIPNTKINMTQYRYSNQKYSFPTMYPDSRL